MPLPFDLRSGGRHEPPKQPKAGDPSALFMLGFPDLHANLRPKTGKYHLRKGTRPFIIGGASCGRRFARSPAPLLLKAVHDNAEKKV